MGVNFEVNEARIKKKLTNTIYFGLHINVAFFFYERRWQNSNIHPLMADYTELCNCVSSGSVPLDIPVDSKDVSSQVVLFFHLYNHG